MKRSILVSVLSVLVIIAIVSMLSAQPGKDLMVQKKMKSQPRMLKGLNLTDEQQSKISELKLKLQKERLPLRTELQSKMADLNLLKTEDNPDLNKLDQLIEEAQRIRTKIQKATVRHQLEVRKLLTAEQQKIWDSYQLKGPGEKFMGRGFKRAMHQF